MKKILAFLVVLASLQMAPSAWAAWGSFVSTGTATGFGNPSCASFAAGSVACAVRSGTSTMMVNTYASGAWGKWKNLAGAVSSDPSCTSDGAAGHPPHSTSNPSLQERSSMPHVPRSKDIMSTNQMIVDISPLSAGDRTIPHAEPTR